jgi:hypothetical protein
LRRDVVADREHDEITVADEDVIGRPPTSSEPIDDIGDRSDGQACGHRRSTQPDKSIASNR